MEGRGNQNENPVVSFFVNLFDSIKLAIPNPNRNKKKDADEPIVEKSSDADVIVKDDSDKGGDYVTFPKQNQSFEPVKLELVADEAEKKTNPVLLWQVYAIGGFFVIQWAWKRWNEHKERKKRDNDEPPANRD